MKLPFETWVREHSPTHEARVAFNEAVSTYKAGAYRAALVFSYVGMGLCLRLRLLSATCPTGLPQGQWNEIQRNLNDESKWDATVFDCTQMRAPKDVFFVEEDLRVQMKYWKDRRNDCAHFKSNEIGAPHVEAFWMFLQSNLGRWVPNGSEEDLLNRMVRHFDPNITPQGADVTPIVKMIPQAVPQTSLRSFFVQLTKRLPDDEDPFGTNIDNIVSVFDAVFKTKDQIISDHASAFLRDNQEILLHLLRKLPIYCAILRAQPELVRRMWRELLFDGWTDDTPVFAALLRNGLIPDEQIEESVSWVVEKARGEGPKAMDNQTLERVGFWDVLQRRAFAEKAIEDFTWANNKAPMIARLLKDRPLDPTTTSTILELFSKHNHSWAVCDVLRKVLSDNPSKRTQLEEAATEAMVEIPCCIVREPGAAHINGV